MKFTLILTLLLATPSSGSLPFSPTDASQSGAPHRFTELSGTDDGPGEAPQSTVAASRGAPLPTAETGAIPGSVNPMSALRGYATWYATPGLTGAAGPVLREALGDWRGQHVTVCSGKCVTVTLTDWCACSPRAGQPTLVDLSSSAFRRLAPLSSGVIEVTIRVAAPEPTLPATDTAP